MFLMNKKNITLSLIIVSYKSGGMLIDCIASVIKNNDLEDRLEIILVDNSPDHADYYSVKEIFPFVVCIKNKNNGFGEANNVGASVARGEYVFFLNPDTLLIEPIFKKCINKFKCNENLALVGVKLLNKELKPNCSIYLIGSGGLIRSAVTKLLNYFDLYVQRFCHISGSAMFFRRDFFYKCGKFDENIFMYYEEPDISLRVSRMGWDIEYLRQIKVIHAEGGSTDDKAAASKRRIVSLIYFCKKYNLSSAVILSRELRLLRVKIFLATLFNKNVTKFNEELLVLKDGLEKASG